MTEAFTPVFPLTGSIRLRAVHILNGRSRDTWESDIAALRKAMDDVIGSLYAQELENFSVEFATRLANGKGWELCHVPEYMRDEDGLCHIDYDDARSLLENWPDPTNLPDGYPDQKLSDIEALEEVLYQRRKHQGKAQPNEAQCYALMALEKIALTDMLFSETPKPSQTKNRSSIEALRASATAIEAMEMICTAERKILIEKLAPAAKGQAREIEAMITADVKRALAISGAKNRWGKDPKTLAKQQVKECWDLWQANPKNYVSSAAFSRDMLFKFEELKNSEVIQKWCREWRSVAASTDTTLPVKS